MSVKAFLAIETKKAVFQYDPRRLDASLLKLIKLLPKNLKALFWLAILGALKSWGVHIWGYISRD